MRFSRGDLVQEVDSRQSNVMGFEIVGNFTLPLPGCFFPRLQSLGRVLACFKLSRTPLFVGRSAIDSST